MIINRNQGKPENAPKMVQDRIKQGGGSEMDVTKVIKDGNLG
jgi:hypothetical protein